MPQRELRPTPTIKADWVVFRKTRAFKAMLVFFACGGVFWTGMMVLKPALRTDLIVVFMAGFWWLLTVYFSLYTLVFRDGVLHFFGICRVNGKTRLLFKIPVEDLQCVQNMGNYGRLVRKNGDTVDFDTICFRFDELSDFMAHRMDARHIVLERHDRSS